METAGEELSRLRAETVSLRQLLAIKNELLASKDAGLAGRAAELQRSQELLQHSTAVIQSDAAAIDSSKRQVLYDSSVLPLDRDDILGEVFSFVGGGDHLYVSGISRRWRGRYIQYCVRNSTSELDGKLMTRQGSVLMTESRLQLALSSGLTVKDWTFDKRSRAALICCYSLEPEEVLTLLRAHGVPWCPLLCEAAAHYSKLPLLRWLHANSCPWDEDFLLVGASMGGSVALLEWLMTAISSWSRIIKTHMLIVAGCANRLEAAQWLPLPKSHMVFETLKTRKCVFADFYKK
jgi:hypothetical protein